MQRLSYCWIKAALCVLGWAVSGCAATSQSVVTNPRLEVRQTARGRALIGDRETVNGECMIRLGSTPAPGNIFAGCTDFTRHEIVSVDDPAIIDHEFCHLETGSRSHAICRAPLVLRVNRRSSPPRPELAPATSRSEGSGEQDGSALRQGG